MMPLARRIHALLLALAGVAVASADEVTVADSQEMRAAVASATPGTTILLSPGVYEGGLYFRGVNGAEDAPITLRAADLSDRPVFQGGGQALHFADCNHLVLSGIVARGHPTNGINIDDGGTFDTPSRYIVLENVTIERIGPTGNHDALKMSGVDDFEIRHCTFRGWGGSAIDMVGCHRGVVEDCTFEGLDGFSQHSGIQMKGGTTDVVVRESHFLDAGQRAINLGGSTGLQYFRPRPEGYEATRIEVTANRFEGSDAVVAWVNARGGHVHRNTIHMPTRWVLRILQENNADGFAPCAGGIFEHNQVTFDQRVRTTVNVGPGTAPETFAFRGNTWRGVGVSSVPALPVAEIDGIVEME